MDPILVSKSFPMLSALCRHMTNCKSDMNSIIKLRREMLTMQYVTDLFYELY